MVSILFLYIIIFLLQNTLAVGVIIGILTYTLNRFSLSIKEKISIFV